MRAFRYMRGHHAHGQECVHASWLSHQSCKQSTRLPAHNDSSVQHDSAGVPNRPERQVGCPGRRGCSFRMLKTCRRLQRALGSRAAAGPGQRCHPPSWPRSPTPRAASCAAPWPSACCSPSPLHRRRMLRCGANPLLFKRGPLCCLNTSGLIQHSQHNRHADNNNWM